MSPGKGSGFSYSGHSAIHFSSLHLAESSGGWAATGPDRYETRVFPISSAPASDSISKMRELFQLIERPPLRAILSCCLLILLALSESHAQTGDPTRKTGTEPPSKQEKPSVRESGPKRNSDPQGCALYRAMARTAPPSRERTYALRALKACPASAIVARLLEKAIQSDDFAARAAALESLETHMDRASVPFLVALYDSLPFENQDRETEIRIFEYLSRLTTPTISTPPAIGRLARVPERILIRGLTHSQARIRSAALLGLGRRDESRHWPLIQATMLNPRSPGERIAALEAARQMKQRNSLEALAAAREALQLSARQTRTERRSASQPEPTLERAAIELLGSLGTPRALETLLIYSVRQTASSNQELLRKTLQRRMDPKRNYAYALAPARIYESATERSPIQAAVAAHTVLYIEESTGLGYRLPPEQERAQPESNWLRVYTTDGLRGWVHASKVRRLTGEPMPAEKKQKGAVQ